MIGLVNILKRIVDAGKTIVISSQSLNPIVDHQTPFHEIITRPQPKKQFEHSLQPWNSTK